MVTSNDLDLPATSLGLEPKVSGPAELREPKLGLKRLY